MAGLLAASGFAHAEERRNWFNDPFFQISHGIPACRAPLGPLITEAERRVESHSRAERGTTCWLAGQCAKANAYFYDAGIAQALRDRLAAAPHFADFSLWVTVQRRLIFVEGCVRNASDERDIVAFLQAVPDVERVFINVSAGPTAKPPYKTADAAPRKKSREAP
jgi:hypothetical protein